MRTSAYVLLLLLGASPAFAADCTYVDTGGDKLRFLSDGQSTVTISRRGKVTDCTWARSAAGTGQNIACDDGLQADYFFAPSSPKVDDRGLLVFNNEVWYCKVGL